MPAKQFTGKSNIQIDQFFSSIASPALKSIRDPFGIFGIDFSIKWVNKAMAFIHHSKPEDMIGKNCYVDFCKKSNACGNCPIVHVRDTGKAFITERWLDFSDGVRRWGEVKAYPIWDDNQKLLAVTILVIETTDIKNKLQRKKEYAEYLSNLLNKNAGMNKKIKIQTEDIKFTVNMSKRETEVLRLLTEGYTNTRISEALSISPNTVKRHVDNVFNKLGVNDRTQAAVLAIRNKLI